jgi:DNA gyrase/topoisomerase IV subunit A
MVIRMQTSDIREIGRNTAGVRIMNLREGDRIVAVQPVPAVESAPVAEAPAEPVVEAEASEDGQ